MNTHGGSRAGLGAVMAADPVPSPQGWLEEVSITPPCVLRHPTSSLPRWEGDGCSAPKALCAPSHNLQRKVISRQAAPIEGVPHKTPLTLYSFHHVCPKQHRSELCRSQLPVSPMGTQGKHINIATSLPSLPVSPQVQGQISSFLADMGAGELFALAVI